MSFLTTFLSAQNNRCWLKIVQCITEWGTHTFHVFMNWHKGCKLPLSPNSTSQRRTGHLITLSSQTCCQFTFKRLKVIPADFIETTQSITVNAKRIKQKWRYLPPLSSSSPPPSSLLSFHDAKMRWPSRKSNSRRESSAFFFFYKC